MKMFTNLPGLLHAIFGFLRIVTILLAVFWLLTLTFNTWIQQRFVDEPKLIVTVGEVSLPAAPGTVGLNSASAKPGSLVLQSLRGTLQMDLCSQDAALVSALRWTMIPSMVVVIAFAWILFTSLRNVCANIAGGEVFSDKNLRLVRGIGLTLIGYSLIGAGLQVWASQIMGGYLNQQAVLSGLPLAGGSGAMHFHLTPGLISSPGGLLTGALVLVVAEAFRQGLNLKTENDLTV